VIKSRIQQKETPGPASRGSEKTRDWLKSSGESLSDRVGRDHFTILQWLCPFYSLLCRRKREIKKTNKSILLKDPNDKSQVKRQDVCTLFLFMECKV
jgi:hypothetical protein